MSSVLTNEILIAVLFGIIGAVAFTFIGLISGTDETATIAPLTLLVILLGAPRRRSSRSSSPVRSPNT
ncbi:hypothetical protein ACETU7_06925 [Rhodococcus sp. 3Y1]